jgi:4-amino-4-deoxy-L-arabinose transferase-like glycosyltransferase
MRLNSKPRQILTGAGLMLLVLLTRLPFVAHTLFEFDSVDFAVALHRFSLEQVTPHMPGYILHILFGRVLEMFTEDANTAFVWVSILLSIGSTLFLWRAAYWLRGERVALIAALIWLTNPLFWFYGEVATVYPHEAFYAAALLYFGIALYRRPSQHWRAIGLWVILSLATGTRQSSLLFFLPAILYVFVTTHQPRRIWVGSILVFAFVTAWWVAVLLSNAGGLSNYLHFASLEHIYRAQSVLFGNPIGEHLAVMAKIIVYMIVGSLPILLTLLFVFIRFSKWATEFVRENLRKPVTIYATLIAIVPLLFYFAIYFMKAGY